MSDAIVIPLDEVKRNNGKNGSKVYIIIEGSVYDVTDYLKEHPGGSSLLKEWAGKDATTAFKDQGHTNIATDTLKTLKVGILRVEEAQTNKETKSVENHVNRTLISRITCGLMR